jgi:1-acyl-sn-glycerol-3-phosphate acyltransferase
VPPHRLPPQVPSTHNAFSRIIGRLAMRVRGWRITGELPDLPKFVIIVAPHTSNWDFFVGLSAKWALGLKVSWIAKHTVFRWPIAGALKRLGGIPVVRDRPQGVVQDVVDAFREREQMVFALAPEGTRRRVAHWRSGYWHVARAARVPIVPVALDYALRMIYIGPPHETSASLEDDEQKLRRYFARIKGKRDTRV